LSLIGPLGKLEGTPLRGYGSMQNVQAQKLAGKSRSRTAPTGSSLSMNMAQCILVAGVTVADTLELCERGWPNGAPAPGISGHDGI